MGRYLSSAQETQTLVNEIDATDLHSRLSAGAELHLYDIRSEAELMRGVLPNAQHLPMHLIPLKIGEMPKHEEVILYCHSGARSYHACSYLAQQGYDNVINLRGGILDWARNGFEIVSHRR